MTYINKPSCRAEACAASDAFCIAIVRLEHLLVDEVISIPFGANDVKGEEGGFVVGRRVTIRLGVEGGEMDVLIYDVVIVSTEEQVIANVVGHDVTKVHTEKTNHHMIIQGLRSEIVYLGQTKLVKRKLRRKRFDVFRS